MQPLKMSLKKYFTHFRVTVNMFRGPATSEKATLRQEILELGSYNNLTQHRKCSIFFQNHSTLLHTLVCRVPLIILLTRTLYSNAVFYFFFRGDICVIQYFMPFLCLHGFMHYTVDTFTVKKVLADLVVCDWWCFCKAPCDVKFSQIEGNDRNLSHIQ